MMLNNGMLHEYSHSTGSYAIPNHPTLQRPGGVAFNSATNVDVNAQVDMFEVSPYTHTSPVEWNFNGFSSAVHSASLKTAGTPRRKRKTNPAQRIAANVRERKRMCSLNSAFDRLRRRVPTFPHEKRLSRIQTLKLAMTYIGFMTEVLTGQDINMYAHQQFGSFTEHLIDNQTW